MLLMKKCFFDAIRRGTKTTTLRYWLRPMVRPGSRHRIGGLGTVRIDEVRCVSLSSLTARDARADGFASLRALREILRALYPPPVRRTRRLFRVRFTFLGTHAAGGSE